MYSFRKTRQQHAFALDANIVNKEEFLLLWDGNASKNPDYPVSVYPKFNLDDKDVAEVKTEFRFEKNDIPSLYEVLRIPEVFRCKQGSVCDGMTGLCIMLKRLTYPCRYSDMIPAFGISVPELCMIYNTVVDYIFNEDGHLIGRWNHTLLRSENLQRYADSIAAKEAALQNCFGFVDGTVCPICPIFAWVSMTSIGNFLKHEGHIASGVFFSCLSFSGISTASFTSSWGQVHHHHCLCHQNPATISKSVLLQR